MTEKATECSWCDGTGMIEGDPCPYCDGTGKRLTAFPKATPRPWRQVGQHIVGANGNAVVVADTPFVVEAVNAYDRLARMAEAGEELVAAAQAAVDDPEEFSDMAFTSQRLTRAIAKYEEARDAVPEEKG